MNGANDGVAAWLAVGVIVIVGLAVRSVVGAEKERKRKRERRKDERRNGEREKRKEN